MKLFFLLLISLVWAESLQEQIDALKARLDDRQKAEILLYRDRTDCPIGYSPAENAFGRLLVVDGGNRGAISDHTFNDVRKMNFACAETIGVAESGFQKVCSHSVDGSAVDVQLSDFLPYFKVLACFRNDGPSPVIG
jgi:hypothetical protein